MRRPDTTLSAHPLTADQERWLRASADSPNVPPQTLRLRLRQEVARDFSPASIDPRLYASDQITPLGIWRIQQDHPRMRAIDQTIREVQRRLDLEPPPTSVTAVDIAQATGQSEEAVGAALHDMGSLGSFFTTASSVPNNPNVWSRIDLQGPRAYDDYIAYDGLGELMERLYRGRGSSLDNAFAYQTLHPGILHEQPVPSLPDLGTARQSTAFVIMAMNPDKPDLADTYGTIQRTCEEFGLTALRIDDIEHEETITARVLAEISACPYLIADLTGERPNVYYEIGYAHGLQKSPLLVRKKDARLHFDLSVHKVPEYRNQTELAELLRKRLEALIGRPPRVHRD